MEKLLYVKLLMNDIEISNKVAPEHLELMVKNAMEYLGK